MTSIGNACLAVKKRKMKETAEDILKRNAARIESQLLDKSSTGEFSEDYQKFRQEMVPELTRYEKWAKSLGNFVSLKISEKDRIKIQKYLDIAHLEVSASQALTLALLSMLLIFLLTIMSAISYFLIVFPGGFASLTFNELSDLAIFVFLGIVTSLFVFYYTYSMPQRLATRWRLQASSQMVPAILYVVVYMKHTSNMERAIEFAAQHLEGPLALDFRKIFYDVSIGRFSTIKQSLENYLIIWKDYAPEFIESFHLIESSLLEPSESRRVEILERALQVILDGVYEKMLKFSREIRSPLTNLYMLGIILPTLGLALLPLASTLLGGLIRWPHVFLLFNIIIPFFVFYLVNEVLLKRPGGYGEASALELNPDYVKYKSRKPWIIGALIALPFLIIGFLPFIAQWNFINDTIGLSKDYSFADFGLSSLGEIKFFDFKTLDGKVYGPFGPMAIFFSLFVPLAFMIFFSYVYSSKTGKMIKSRNDTKQLEREFANSLFQLGNRIGDNIPAEIAFGKVANATQGEKSSEFFSLVNYNVQQGGYSLEQAIFDKKRGAIIYYPSALISTSMRILTESVKKGLQIAARSLMSISEYAKNIEKINQRLRDLLSEIISDMKSNMVFLAPLLAGIVVGLASMITFILNKLQGIQIGAGQDVAGLSNFSTILNGFFNVNQMIPPYFLQISVGLYIIEIIFILTGALVTVDAGRDVLREKYELSKNLKRGVSLYILTSLITLVALIVLASVALSGFGG